MLNEVISDETASKTSRAVQYFTGAVGLPRCSLPCPLEIGQVLPPDPCPPQTGDHPHHLLLYYIRL